METPNKSRPTAPDILVQGLPEQRATVARSVRPPWQDRIAELARLAAASPGMDGQGSDKSDTGSLMHHHLDAIESILQDPRPGLVHEVTKCRTRRTSFGTKGLSNPPGCPEDMPSDLSEGACQHEALNHELASSLRTLLGEVTELNQELHRRHAESVEIRELMDMKCRGLARTIAELEDEVSELQSDLVDDSIELEGLQGTVRGLEDWVAGLREGQGWPVLSRPNVGKRYGGQVGNDGDAIAILDGLGAWMRGWRDVEDGHKARARARKLRRDQRQELLKRRGRT
ncbi:hypothetical protein N7468_006965 [Penicillium chermesinum]|uniref:Uncharacterized protein n=1 Tax=Penicillium chermesinum TaxID=63820 RepID=A0A9W9TLQ7_9EURO|nr:uncharacterized protein N7468_006965 [Penicillium chermesinum]KAJ5225740.1 hypothetical protein N7468_006965 [Penicillium chermesinum]